MFLKQAIIIGIVPCLFGCLKNPIGQNPDTGIAYEDVSIDTQDLPGKTIALNKPTTTRATGAECDDYRPEQIFEPGDAGCKADNECMEGKNGRCLAVWSFEKSERRCNYDECFNDGDCGPSTACSCGKNENADILFGTGADENRCVNANCKTDADCGTQFCKPQPGGLSLESGSRVHGFYCTTENDECRDDSDCSSRCVYWLEEEKWVCMAGDE